MKVIDKRIESRTIRFEDLPVGNCFMNSNYENTLYLKYSDTYRDNLDNAWDFTEVASIHFFRDDMVLPVDTEIHIIK